MWCVFEALRACIFWNISVEEIGLERELRTQQRIVCPVFTSFIVLVEDRESLAILLYRMVVCMQSCNHTAIALLKIARDIHFL